jgi:hypothetical protein
MSICTPGSGSVSPQNTGCAPSGVLPTPVESIKGSKVSTANQTADFKGVAGALEATNQLAETLADYKTHLEEDPNGRDAARARDAVARLSTPPSK